MSSSVAVGDTEYGVAKRRKEEEKKEKKKRNERRDIKGRENAGSYDNYEKGRKKRLGVRRLVKWNRGRETIVYKFDRWNFSFHPFLFSLYFFPPASNYGSFDKWAPYDPIKTREKWRKRTFHLIFGNVIKGNKNLAVHSITSNSVRLLFRVLFPFVGSITHNLTFFAGKSIGKFSNNIFRRVKPWKEIESSLCVCVLIKRKLTQSSIVLYIYIRIFHSLSLFEFHYFDIFEDYIELIFRFIYDYSIKVLLIKFPILWFIHELYQAWCSFISYLFRRKDTICFLAYLLK